MCADSALGMRIFAQLPHSPSHMPQTICLKEKRLVFSPEQMFCNLQNTVAAREGRRMAMRFGVTVNQQGTGLYAQR